MGIFTNHGRAATPPWVIEMLNLVPLQALLRNPGKTRTREEKLIRINDRYYYHQPTQPGPSLFNEKCELARLIKIRFGQLITRREWAEFSYGLWAHDLYYSWFQGTYPHVTALFEHSLIYSRISAIIDIMYMLGDGWVVVEIKSSPWRPEPSWVKQVSTYIYIAEQVGFRIIGAQIVAKDIVVNYDYMHIPFLSQSGRDGFNYLKSLPDKDWGEVRHNTEKCRICPYAKLCPIQRNYIQRNYAPMEALA